MWPFKKSKQVKQEENVEFPANDADIDGIYRYLAWHMYKAGMSSTCFHFLEVLKVKASKENIMSTIEEIKDAGSELSDRITKLLIDYEEECGVEVKDLSVGRLTLDGDEQSVIDRVTIVIEIKESNYANN